MKPVRYFLLPLILLAIAIGSVRAQSAGGGSYPVPYGPNNVGTEFFMSFPANWDYAAAYKYIRLYITSGVETTVRVYAGPTLVRTVQTVAYGIVTVDLTLEQAQVFTRNDRSDVPPDQVYKKKAVKIVSEDPIVVYGINRITATSDGMLALPTSGIGREYIVASARDITGGFQKLPSQYMVIAPYDGTTVTIINSAQTPNHGAGEVVNVQMDSGDVYSAMSAEGTGGDLTGTFISASRPVVVTAGQNCTYLPTQQYGYCDHLCEMMLPISSWGTVYHSVPFANRTKGDLYRIFSGEPNAKIFINGAHIATLPQVGGDQGGGWLEYLPPDRKLLEFSSDKPIMIAQYNNSQTYDNATGTDPMFLVLTPVEQFQTDLVFCTPGRDYGDNYINLVADSASYYSIEIAKDGLQQYDKLALRYPTLVRNFTSLIDGKPYIGVSFRIDPGVYHMRGPGPFAGYIYGFNNYDSYGYPLSAATGDLSKNDSIAPEVTATQDCFGTVQGTVLDLPHEDSVRTNMSSVRLDRTASFNYRLTVAYFRPGESPGTVFRLNVVDPTRDAQAVVLFSDMRGNTTRDTFYYSSFKVTTDSADLRFGSFFAGENRTMSTTIRNQSTRPITITQTSLRFGDRGFTILDPTSEFTLAPAGSGAASTRVITVRFDATVAGRFTDEIGLKDDCGFRYVTRLSANVGTPIISVSDIDFKKWPVSAPPSIRTFTITNVSDGGVLTVRGVARPVNDNITFTLPNGLPAFPMDLGPGESSNAINVGFKPNAVQAYADSIVFDHNAPPNPLNDPTAVLIGEGIQGSLIATSYDWQKRRVDGRSHSATITLTNIGTADVTLRPGATITGNAGDFSIVSPSQYEGVILAPNASVVVDVLFTPQATGPRAATITWPHDPQQSEPVTSELLGFGTMPGLVTSDYDFGSMDVSEPNDVTRQIVFRLPPVGSPDVMDSVTIVDFVIAGDVNDFRFDKPALPIILKRGDESVTFTGYFNATAPGPRSARVTAITLPTDNVNVTSNWTGVGTVRDPVIEGEPINFTPALCATSATLNAVVRNTGLVPITITNLQLQGLPPSFVIDPSLQLPITIEPGAALNIPVTFTASGNGVFDGVLIVTNTSTNAPSLALRVQGASVAQDVDVAVDLTALGPLGKVELGKEFLAKVNMTEAIDPAIPIRNYRVTLTYDPEQTEPVEAGIAVGSANPTAAWSVVSNAPGALVLDVNSPAPLGPTGTLIEVPFAVYFHASETRRIDASVTTNDAACLTYTTTPDSIGVVPICGLSVRLITMNATTYALNQNVPNPFNPVTKINYSLGLDGRTQIHLRDAAGKLIQTLLDEHQQPGTYELTLDVTDLPSGMYYYTLTSGHWSDTKVMSVVK